ncbi:uncharacterized protein LOC108673747 [Hyalella azteca]|uniref:Uncharacterized protein LOC108673747 n=1 Tax=Hyalella azteca TaxID=294128 RepID=A0A8B7NTL8_HYAAZ|nr:uncharacterized protein LOC108673747 [Hyalella azteca]
MQAAIFVRNKKNKRGKIRGKVDPRLTESTAHLCTKPIQPFPRFNPIFLPNGKNAWRTDEKKSRTRNPNRRIKVAAEDDSTDSDEEDVSNGVSQPMTQSNKSTNPNNKQGGVVNILLYLGFLFISVGLILTLVGQGQRGFKSEELKLIGPTLIISGVVFSLLRVLFCSCNTCNKPKPSDEKTLLSPSSDTLDGAGTSNPAFQGDHDVPRLPPLRHVQGAPRIVGPSNDRLSPLEPSLSTDPASARDPAPPSQLEDEVEEDMALGLDVAYADDVAVAEEEPPPPPPGFTVRIVSEVPPAQFGLLLGVQNGVRRRPPPGPP